MMDSKVSGPIYEDRYGIESLPDYLSGALNPQDSEPN